MGYDFTLYEVTNYDWEEYQKDFQVKEVLYLSNPRAMLISNWLYRNNIHGRVDDGERCYYYIELYGWQLKHCLENLEVVLNERDENRRDVLALFYFPCKYTIPDFASSTEMFSDHYYICLEDIHEGLNKVLSDNPDRQMFLYNLTI